MDPVAALRQIAYYKDRSRHDPRRVMAYRNAADIIEGLDEADRGHAVADDHQVLGVLGDVRVHALTAAAHTSAVPRAAPRMIRLVSR